MVSHGCNFSISIHHTIVFSLNFDRIACVKKSVALTVKYLASGCQFFYRYFYGRLPVEHF